MMSLRIPMVFAAMLISIALAVPALAASAIGLTAKSAWGMMDTCTKQARDKYPEETADALAKRDAYAHTCQRDNRVPVRSEQAQKK